MAGFVETIVGGLTYGGAAQHIAINYGLVFASIGILAFPPAAVGSGKRRWIALLVTISLIQAALWFIANAQGISLIWSTLYGYIFAVLISEKRWHPASMSHEHPLLPISLAAGIAGFLFYAISLPPITTAAHAIAAIIGGAWFALSR